MNLCIVSDTHRFHRDIKIPECDVLIHCGDIGAEYDNYGRMALYDFLDWFSECPARERILVFGNHDRVIEFEPWTLDRLKIEYPGVHILHNSGVRLGDLNFWGSPYTLEFCGWSFQIPREEDRARRFWSQIPEDTDVVITHGPCYGILDKAILSNDPDNPLSDELVYPPLGDRWLLERINEVKPKLHCCGHIHGNGNRKYQGVHTLFVNASICTEHYEPTNPAIQVEI